MLSLSDSKEFNFTKKRTTDTIKETKIRLMAHNEAIRKAQSEAHQKVAQECSCSDLTDIRKLYEQVVDGSVSVVVGENSAVKDAVVPNEKCLDPVLKGMLLTAALATVSRDLKACDAIAAALEHINL